jgi:nucleoside-diphosphate-sugar epimerase
LNQKILITGAGGYVGTKLVEKLLENKYQVIALDTYWFNQTEQINNVNLEVIKADLRYVELDSILANVDKVVHLASISNDPSYELNPIFSKEINYYASLRLIEACKKSKISRFIFASSSSVYGVKEEENVTECLALDPLTDYSRYKLKIEEVLLNNKLINFDVVILRPATICGPSPRMRLDVIGNIFSAQGFFDKKITVHGGGQYRAQLHIDDMIRAYEMCLFEQKNFDGAIYNISEKNYLVSELASLVGEILNNEVEIITQSTQDHRSYRINSEKIKAERGFSAIFSGKNAIEDNLIFFEKNAGINWKDDKFHNIKTIAKILDNENK